MEIKIGIKELGREVSIESTEDEETILQKVSEALENRSVLSLKDSKGNTTLVPGDSLGYVQIGAEAKRHIGFGPFSEN